MNRDQDPIAALIDHYMYGPETGLVPRSLEVRQHSWRASRQARFDELGLPRGLATDATTAKVA